MQNLNSGMIKIIQTVKTVFCFSLPVLLGATTFFTFIIPIYLLDGLVALGCIML